MVWEKIKAIFRRHDDGTYLVEPAELGNLDVLRILLDRGASPNIEALGQTPQSFAESRGKTEVVALLDKYSAS